MLRIGLCWQGVAMCDQALRCINVLQVQRAYRCVACCFSRQAFHGTLQVDVPAGTTEAFMSKHYINSFVLFNVLDPKVDGVIRQ